MATQGMIVFATFTDLYALMTKSSMMSPQKLARYLFR
jgi:hypothetical protein